MTELLAGRRINRTMLMVRPIERSTLAQGRPGTKGAVTCYEVIAASNASRATVKLAEFRELQQAQRYIAEFSLGSGLVTNTANKTKRIPEWKPPIDAGIEWPAGWRVTG